MTEDVKPEVIKKTQDILGKFIKKPTLSEKLLKKPPFRFLYDICISVMKETGFFEGVLNSEQDKYENIKDKEGKIEFLQKVIAAVEAANGGRLTVKPNKIVAGLEATKTNEFLQALGKALENQSKNSKPAAPTKVKTTKKSAREVKEEPPDKKKPPPTRNSKRIIENGVHEPGENQSPRSPKKKHPSKKIEEPTQRQNESDVEVKERNGFVEETSPEKKGRRSSRGAGESVDVPDVDIVRVNGADGQGDQNLIPKEEVIQNNEERRGQSGSHRNRKSSIYSEQIKAPTEEEKANLSAEKPVQEKVNLINKSEIILKEQNRSTPSPSGQPHFRKDANQVREGALISRPRTGIRPTTARPASARPAAPRIRDRGEVAIAEEVLKPASGKVQVIVDEDATNEAEEEALISLETPNDILLEEPTPFNPPTNSNGEQEHGHLVEQILEVQRELEDDSRFSEAKSTGKTEIEWESGRESANREIEKLRTSIQALTRTANPLGKLLDFFQEDVEIVQKELESWREKNSSYCLQIAHEKSITEQFVEPLKIHLKEIQQSIEEQLEQISAVKANIIRNNEKIHKLLAGL